MYRNFLKNCVGFFIVLVLIAGCEGQSCIEADDFGEYNTDIITVDSIGSACEWTDDGEYGTGSETIRQCLDRERTGYMAIQGTQCKIKAITCNNLKECLIDTSASCANNFTIEGLDDDDDDSCQPSDDESRKSLVRAAYNTCLEGCIDECTSSESYSYEPKWVLNNLKEKGGYLGIELSKSNKVYVQALGSVILQGSVSENKDFSVNTPKVQDIGFILSKGIPFTLTGKWCRNGSSLTSCESSKQVGEFGGDVPAGMPDNSNLEKRIDFLRRGVIILDPLPEDSTFTSEGKYSGPLRSPDFNAWKCPFDNTDGSYTCYSDFSTAESGYSDQNHALYDMENYFRKRLGGSVIPENVRELITINPFANFECKTILGTNISCTPTETEAFTVDFPGTSESNKTVRTGFVLTKDGKTGLEVIYPSKLAFRIIPDASKTSSTSNECKVTVTVQGNSHIQNKVVTVKADGGWHFLNESENSTERLTLDRDKYNTLMPISESSSLQNLNRPYKVNIKFDSNQKWTDKDGNQIFCGDGMVAFFLPQNEILVDTSGFVSFKNLLGDNQKNCAESSTTEDKDCINDYILTFDIINPMYEIRDNAELDLLEKNFYEYRRKIDGNTKPIKQSVTIKLGSDTTNDGWSDPIYVRKGQILRFDETNWYSIVRKSPSVEDADSFDIKNKVLQIGNYVKKPNEGLVMKIVERPAIICRGSANEKYTNPLCNLTIDDNGEQVCSLSYSDYCSEVYYSEEDDEDLTDAQKTANARYCPFGCYGNFFVDSTNASTACMLTGSEDDKKNYPNISETTCRNCKNYINTLTAPQVEYDVNVTQCYNLENYTGAVSNIANEIDPITSEKYSAYQNDVEKYGNLTLRDSSLGATKLKSIFEDGSYGSLEGLELDTTKKGTNSKYDDFIYNVVDGLQFNSPRSFRFLVIDNPDFTFKATPDPDKDLISDPSQKTSYNGNTGNYSFSFTPQEIMNNGAQMSVFVAHKDWIEGKDNYTPSTNGKFKAWIVQYNMDRTTDGNYGKLNAASPYEFDTNGILINRSTKGQSIDMSTLPIQGVDEDGYKDLRLFFKIIDKEEKPAGNCTSFEAQRTVGKCRCKNWASSRTPEDCSTISCGNDFSNIENVDVTECQDLYSNNSGSYTVQLKTPKDVLNSTGYIVKYVMEPIMEILDGKTIGIAVDHDGNPIPCKGSDSQYTYGGILPLYKVGQPCSTTDPIYGQYCISTTKECGGNDLNPAHCFLPGATASRIGEACKVDDNSNVTEYGNYCYSTPTDRCVIYKPQDQIDVYDDTFGDTCKPGSGDNCVQNCSTLDTNTYKNYCKFVSDGKGFVQKFYEAVINDSAYQIILRLCFTLMIMFYGLYYLLGMAELTHGELIRRVIKISFIYLMVGTDGWYYYNMFFVKFFKGGVDYLVFAVAGAFDDSSSLAAAFVENNFYDKSVLFSGVDKNLALMFSDQVTFKIWGLMFVSFFGWLYVFLIYSSIIAYIMAVANALLLYLTAQFFISMLLAFGPIFFVLLVFEKTKEMFNKWINNLVSFSLEQIFLLTCLSLFNMLVYNIIKFVLSYRVCWRPVWVLNIPLLGNIELMSFWKATTASSPSAAASAVPGLFQILLIYLIADLMKKFIEFATNLGASMGGGGLTSSDLSGGIKKAAGDFYDKNIKAPIQATAKKVGTAIAKKTIGYKTKEEEKKEEESNKVMRQGLRAANRDADKAVEDFKKKEGEKLFTDKEGKPISAEQRNKMLADLRRQAFKDSVEKNGNLSAELKKRKMSVDDLANSRASEFTSSNSILGLGGNMLAHSFGKANKSEAKSKNIEEGKKSLHFEKDSKFGIPNLRRSAAGDFSQNEIRKLTGNKEKEELKELDKERGSVFNRQMTDEEYERRKKEINERKHDTRRSMNIQEHEKKDQVKAQEEAVKNTTGAAAWWRRNGIAITKKQKANKAKAIQARALAQDLKEQMKAEFKASHEGFESAGRANLLRVGTNKERFKFGTRFSAAARSLIPNKWQNQEKKARIQKEAYENKRNRAQYESDLKEYRALGKKAQIEATQRMAGVIPYTASSKGATPSGSGSAPTSAQQQSGSGSSSVNDTPRGGNPDQSSNENDGDQHSDSQERSTPNSAPQDNGSGSGDSSSSAQSSSAPSSESQPPKDNEGVSESAVERQEPTGAPVNRRYSDAMYDKDGNRKRISTRKAMKDIEKLRKTDPKFVEAYNKMLEANKNKFMKEHTAYGQRKKDGGYMGPGSGFWGINRAYKKTDLEVENLLVDQIKHGKTPEELLEYMEAFNSEHAPQSNAPEGESTSNSQDNSTGSTADSTPPQNQDD